MTRLRRQRGAVALEFALVFPVALTLLAGIMYLGLHATYSGLAEHGVRNAARYGGIRSLASGTYPTDAEITTGGAKVDVLLGTPMSVVVSRRGGSGSSNLACVVSGAGRRCGDGDVITVTARYNAGALTPLISLMGIAGDGTITRTATARFE
ncbi:MAG: TadE family protein [Acidimicrobiales bacterium]